MMLLQFVKYNLVYLLNIRNKIHIKFFILIYLFHQNLQTDIYNYYYFKNRPKFNKYIKIKIFSILNKKIKYKKWDSF